MTARKMSLFQPIVKTENLNSAFEHMRTSPAAEPARLMAEEIFHTFSDRDGNFVEQFQSTGFDSRIFELYLYAYFSRSGYKVDRKQSPDFIVARDGVATAIEATTVNPTQTKDTVDSRGIVDFTEEELREKLNNELPIRFGGPLFSKLNKAYWELEQCKEMPIVFAIEAFHGKDSLYFTDSSLGQYLYGLRHYPDWSENGLLVVRSQEVGHHKLGEKVIPSNFFRQPETEHVSAVIFSNSGTYAKFWRMGVQASYGRGNVEAVRHGVCYDTDPNATKPLEFTYQVDDPPLLETWGQGLVVFHNPYALFPVPRAYFVDAAQVYIDGGQMKTDVPRFHPFMSQTIFSVAHREPFDSVEADHLEVQALLKGEFDSLKPARHPATIAIALEKEWFADRGKTILGALLIDRTDKDWLYVVLGRDESGVFRWIDGAVSIASRDEARKRLLTTMQTILDSGQKVFPQG